MSAQNSVAVNLHQPINKASQNLVRASLLVPSEDYSQIEALCLPISLIEVTDTTNGMTFSDEDGETLSYEVVMLRAVGQAALTSAGRNTIARLSANWSDQLGTEPPKMAPPCNNGEEDIRVHLSDWLIGQMADARLNDAQRATRFMRELGLLRGQHAEMQSSFRALEHFIYQSGLSERKLETTLSPVWKHLPISLQNGSQLSLRLPISSIGLSDIALHIAHATPGHDGVLHLSLFSPDTNQTLAIWEVFSQQISEGWLRFSMDRALGSDAVSLFLITSYQGAGTIQLSSSIKAPEQRFRTQLDNETLSELPSLKIWRWLAGSVAPTPVGAVIPVGGTDRLRRVERDVLATTLDYSDLSRCMPLAQSGDAVTIHVLEGLTACGLLSGVGLPGARQVMATVCTRHAEGPEIEYQMALFPRQSRVEQTGQLPKFELSHCSQWVRLPAMEEGQVHIMLPEPLDEPHDIYLLTRLCGDRQTNAYGWSTFSDICLQF